MEIIRSLLPVFMLGGFFSLIAQILIDLTSLTPARILVFYVCLGVLLFAVGIYEPLYDSFGSGISVPLIGFGANIGRGVKEAIDSQGIIGALSGGLTAASSGITASLILGLVLSFFCASKPKRM